MLGTLSIFQRQTWDFAHLVVMKELKKTHTHFQEQVSLKTRLDKYSNRKKGFCNGQSPSLLQMRDVGRNSFPILSLDVLLWCWWYHLLPVSSTERDLAAFHSHCHCSQSAFSHRIKMPKSYFYVLTTAVSETQFFMLLVHRQEDLWL